MRFQERTHVRTFPEAAVCQPVQPMREPRSWCAIDCYALRRGCRYSCDAECFCPERTPSMRNRGAQAFAALVADQNAPLSTVAVAVAVAVSSRRKRSRHCRRHRRHNVHDRSHSVLSGHSCQRQSTHCHGRQRDQQHQRRQRDQQGHHRARGEEDHRGQGEEEDHPGQGEEEDHRRGETRRRGEEADRRYQGEEEGRRVETRARYSVRILQRRVSCWPTGSEVSCAT